MPQRGVRTAESDAIEFALLVLMILMVTPLSFGYFFSWLMLPFAVITQRVTAGKGAALLYWSLPALVIVALALPFPRGAQLYGNTFFAALLLFIGLSTELLRWKERNLQLEPAP
jgi:alpha-1,2-mannosyltransferase